MTMGIMCLVSFGFCIATVYSMAQSSLIVDSIPRTALPVCTHILTAGVTDIYIAISFSFILHGKRTGFRGTDHIITRLVLYTIQRGIVVTLVHFIEFATFFSTLLARPFKLFWLVLYFSGSKHSTYAITSSPTNQPITWGTTSYLASIKADEQNVIRTFTPCRSSGMATSAKVQ